MTVLLIFLTGGFFAAAFYSYHWRLVWNERGLFWQPGVWCGFGKARPFSRRRHDTKERRRFRPRRIVWLLRVLWELREHFHLDALSWQPGGERQCIVSCRGGDIILSIWRAGRRKRHDRRT